MFSSNASQVSSDANYIEDVFSTYLYTGNGATQTITNGVDLAGKGGLVWVKQRGAATSHILSNQQGTFLSSDYSGPLTTLPSFGVTAFNSNGFTLNDTVASQIGVNYPSGSTYASWTFRKQPKFFDVVTYTGDGTGLRQIPHSLASVPGCIIVKDLNTSDKNWNVWHTSLNSEYESKSVYLNLGSAAGASNRFGNLVLPSATTFNINGALNESGTTYVAYLFAHDAGGFGLSGTENVVSCGSFTTDASGNATINLGYEPQFLITKVTNQAGAWDIHDTMRGLNVTSTSRLVANTSDSENNQTINYVQPNATGFAFLNGFGGESNPYIYIAIRRGPMKVPTDGTKVFAPIAATTGTQTTGFPIDMMMQFWRTSNDIYANTEVVDRLRGVSSNSTAQSNYLLTTSTGATDSLGAINASKAWTNTGFDVPPAYAGGSNGFECFRRAPSFFDEVCYTGTGSGTTVSHNLAAVPELIIVKSRSNTGNWATYNSFVGIAKSLALNLTNGSFFEGGTYWNNTLPTSTVFSVATDNTVNGSARTYVAYLFATCAGVSKVGSYTGTGTTQAINCGFTAGARFVMIKRTDDVGDWYVWDSARGIVAGDDPHLSLNTTAAEVTTDDSIDVDSAGFIVNQNAATNINVTSATYIFLSVA